jgi:predicted membrane channel-forming protein YqfA (hemolysin III family)
VEDHADDDDVQSTGGHLADRELNELVQELRLVLPGTTVLFGFLLSVPFSARYERLGTLDRVVYFVAFVATAIALVFLLAEAGYHRVRGKPYDKRVMIRTTSHQAIGGLIALGTALLACVGLVADFVYDAWAAFLVGIPLAVGGLWMWFGLPLYRRVRGDPPRHE